MQHFLTKLASSYANARNPGHDTQRLVTEIRELLDAFQSLPRPAIGAEALCELKFKVQQWRHQCAETLLKVLQGNPTETTAISAFESLARLQFKPSEKSLKTLARAYSKHASPAVQTAAAQTFAVLGEPALVTMVTPQADAATLRLAGPGRKLPIVANAPSRCTIRKWGPMPDFSEYAFEGEGVRYRGLHLLPGDTFLCNVNRDGNGTYIFLTEPRACGYHLGVFAIIELEGRKVPVVVEAYKLGVRTVPLSTFFSTGFSSYIEVMRPKTKPHDFHAKLNQRAATLESEVVGYNFDTEDTDRRYLACTTVGTHLFELAGAPPVKSKSRYTRHPVVLKTLEMVDLMVPDFLSPSDYLIDEQLEHVGVVDNGHFVRNVARELCERGFFRILEQTPILRERLPLLTFINLFGLKQVKAGTPIGKIIGLATGFNGVNLPRGSEVLLGMIEIYEHYVAAAAQKTTAHLEDNLDRSQLVEIASLFEQAATQQFVLAALHKIRRTCAPSLELSPAGSEESA